MGELKEVTTNKRASIRESDHEARVTAWPLHYLLLKGEHNVYEREPQPVWALHDATRGSTETLGKFGSTTTPTLTVCHPEAAAAERHVQNGAWSASEAHTPSAGSGAQERESEDMERRAGWQERGDDEEQRQRERMRTGPVEQKGETYY